MKKYNIHIIISIIIGALFTTFLSDMNHLKNIYEYIIFGFILGSIFIVLIKKYNILDLYNTDEMLINNIKSIFSIIFIVTLSISTLLLIYLYSMGAKSIALSNLIYYLISVWLFIIIAHIINKIRIWS